MSDRARDLANIPLVDLGANRRTVEDVLDGMGTVLGRTDWTLTAANTFIATALAITHAGATPVLVDVDPVRRTLDPSHVEAAVTAYADLNYPPGSFPVAERAATRILSLPMYPQLPPEALDRVVSAVCAFIDEDVAPTAA